MMCHKKAKENASRLKARLSASWQRYCACNDVVLKRSVIFTTAMTYLLLVWALWLKFNDNLSIWQNYSWLSKMNLWDRFFYDLLPLQFRWDFEGQFWEVVCNCFVFAPFGILFNFLFKKRSIPRDLAICFGFSLFIETLQLFTAIGGFATIDLLTNTLGYFVGYAAYWWILKERSQKFLVWFFRAVNVIAIALFIFAAIRTAQSVELLRAILTRQV